MLRVTKTRASGIRRGIWKLAAITSHQELGQAVVAAKGAVRTFDMGLDRYDLKLGSVQQRHKLSAKDGPALGVTASAGHPYYVGAVPELAPILVSGVASPQEEAAAAGL